MHMQTPEQIANHPICADCIGEEYLKAEVKAQGNSAICFYCKETGNAIFIHDLADRLKKVFEEHFNWTSDEPPAYERPLLGDRESDVSDYVWVRKGKPVSYIITEITQIDDAPAEDIQQILEGLYCDLEEVKMGEENPFAKDACYEPKKADDYEFGVKSKWELLQKKLKFQTRFFNREFEEFLDFVFEDVVQCTTHDKSPFIIEAGPGCAIDHLYRARAFYSADKLKPALMYPDKEIGTPPSSAATAGRMNAKGISVFYGATNPKIALAEIRPPVGSRVVMARFEILRPLLLFNNEALQSISESISDDVNKHGSLFDPSYIARLERSMFLKRLSRQIIKPVMPGDKEFDYLVTQAIFDYLANIVPNLDGIIYLPGQTKVEGYNIALFYRSSIVEFIDIPDDANAELINFNENLSESDGFAQPNSYIPSPFYYISAKKQKRNPFHQRILRMLDHNYPYLIMKPTLKVDETTMNVHHVKEVDIHTDAFPVTWIWR